MRPIVSDVVSASANAFEALHTTACHFEQSSIFSLSFDAKGITIKNLLFLSAQAQTQWAFRSCGYGLYSMLFGVPFEIRLGLVGTFERLQ